MAEFDPTHLIVLGPLTRFIKWGLKTNRALLCVCADSFDINPLRRLIRYGRIASVLNDTRVSLVANHGIPSCLSLARIGVDRRKIIPWDWPHTRQPRDLEPKQSVGELPLTLFFAGLVTKRKGVGELIRAVAELRRRGIQASAKIAGAGEIERYRKLAHSLRVGDDIHFLGLVSNHQVLDQMRQAAIVVVPSQHEYPEGLPLTIYEAFCARTPIVASDHPMFVSRLSHRKNAMIFRAGHFKELADRVEELLDDNELYSSISNEAQTAWEALQLPVKWGGLLHRWLSDTEEDRLWLRSHLLDSPLYQLRSTEKE
ncbi:MULTISPECIES: glycosyltransferase [Bradyrhizobium]|nr:MULTISPECIES: glycosyltransferase [Bradyrhizobium]